MLPAFLEVALVLEEGVRISVTSLAFPQLRYGVDTADVAVFCRPVLHAVRDSDVRGLSVLLLLGILVSHGDLLGQLLLLNRVVLVDGRCF